MIEFIILAICMVGASWQAWQSGLREGAERTVKHLHTAKIISYDNKGNIVPNKFFNV